MEALFRTPVYSAAVDAGWMPHVAIQEWQPQPALVVAEPFGEAEAITLARMLAAVGIALSDANILTPGAGESFSWRALRAASGAKLVLVFGVAVEALGIHAILPAGVPTRFDGCTWVLAPSLTHLQANAEAKRLLWTNGLQPLLQSPSWRL